MTKVSKIISSFVWCFGLAMAVSLLAGCQSSSNYAEIPGMQASGGTSNGGTATPGASASAPAATGLSGESIDRISVGDNLYIVFSDLPTPVLPIEERVREDGTIMLIQNQSFPAAGKMRGELEKEIRARYVPNFFKTMTVSVTHKSNTQFYYVYGDVRKPDRQIYISRLTVLQAIASANGFTDFARKKAVELTRTDGRKLIINCVKAQTDPTKDLEVYPGDKIFVPRRNPIW